jgi:hypothetical protein
MKVTLPIVFVFLFAFAAASPPAVAQTGTLTCSSDDGDYRYCRANTLNHVQLVRELPGPRCRQNYSWGYDYRGIWVDRGCRAQVTYGIDNNSSNNNSGAAVAGAIIGAIIVGAIAANSDDDHDDRTSRQRDAYRDGYRLGQRDWDNNLQPYYMAYRNRFTPDTESSFASGYDDGYNNRRNINRYPNNNYPPPYRDRGTNDPNYGTINNPNHGAGGPAEKVIYCADNSGHGAHCNAITAGGVDLYHQRSGSPCRQNYSWGVDNSGIWVSHGCRADFILHGVAAN